jgi:predicted RNase H-like HicB family nuclease
VLYFIRIRAPQVREVRLKIPIQVHWELPIGVKKDRHGDWYVSWCPVLDVYSQGETRERALENIIEATQLFLMSCFERGTLATVLKRQGFKQATLGAGRRRRTPNLPKQVKMLKVPVPFLVEMRPEDLCPA